MVKMYIELSLDSLIVKKFSELSNKIQNNEISYEELHQECYALEKFLHNKNIQISEEGTITKISTSIIDFFISILNKLKMVTIDFYKPLKESELQYFINSHFTKVKLAKKLPYTRISNIIVPDFPFVAPKDKIIRFYNDINTRIISNMSKINDEILNYSNEMVTLLCNEEYNLIKQKLQHTRFMTQLKDGSEWKKLVTAVIDTQPRRKKFGLLFESSSDFEQYLDNVLQLKDIYTSTKTCLKTIDKINKKIDELIEYKRSEKISNVSDFAKSASLFGDQIFQIAQFYEGYGNVAKLYSMMEHHLVDILRIFIKLI